jgi:hypothetical protein
MDKAKVARRIGMALGLPIGLTLLALPILGVLVAIDDVGFTHWGSASEFGPSHQVNCGSVLAPADPPAIINGQPGAIVSESLDRQFCDEQLSDQRMLLVRIGLGFLALLSALVTLFIIVKRRERRRRAGGAARSEL